MFHLKTRLARLESGAVPAITRGLRPAAANLMKHLRGLGVPWEASA